MGVTSARLPPSPAGGAAPRRIAHPSTAGRMLKDTIGRDARAKHPIEPALRTVNVAGAYTRRAR